MANIKTSAAELIGKTPLLEVKKFEAKENITDAKILAKLGYLIRQEVLKTESH